MKAILFAILLPAALCGAVFHFFLSPEARHERSARRLIEVTRVAEFELAAFNMVFRRSLEKGLITEVQHRCIVDLDRDDFVKLLLPGIQRSLSREEIEAATRFHESPLGMKFMDAIHFEAAKGTPDYPFQVKVEPSFDIDEMEAISIWNRSPAGRKAPDFAIIAEYSHDEVNANIRNRKASCTK